MTKEITFHDFSPMIYSMRDVLDRYLPKSYGSSQNILESSGLLQLFFATFKNAPSALFAREFGSHSFFSFFSSRITYLEVALMTTVSALYHLFFSVIYSGLACVTLGVSKTLNNSAQTHWAHALYATLATAIGTVGVLTPYYAVVLSIYLFITNVQYLKKRYQSDLLLFERPLLKEIQEIFRKNSQLIYDATFTRVRSDWVYKNQFEPSLNFIEKEIYTAEKIDDLIKLLSHIYRKWPTVGHKNKNASLTPKGPTAAFRYYVPSLSNTTQRIVSK